MDPELRSVIFRYSVVGVVLGASVIWAAIYTADRIEAQGGVSVSATVQAATTAGGPTPPSPLPAPRKAPSLASLLVTREGTPRVACEPACALEAYCELREAATCQKVSCDGDVRIAHASDFTFARAETCVQAAAAPCEEACARRGGCQNSHVDDALCTEACLKRAGSNPSGAYSQARCVLESTCAELSRCDTM